MTSSNQPESITAELLSAVVEAVRHAQTKIRWKLGKDISHLSKRVRLRHLPVETTLTEYESIIATILNDDKAKLHIFFYDSTPYPTLVSTFGSQEWLVIIDMNGVMETAFPPDDLTKYLDDPAYVYIGLLKDLAL